MNNSKTFEILNIEICMIDSLITELCQLKKDYKELYDASERLFRPDTSRKFKVEDLLLVNDEIRRKILNILASRESYQETLVGELCDIYKKQK